MLVIFVSLTKLNFLDRLIIGHLNFVYLKKIEYKFVAVFVVIITFNRYITINYMNIIMILKCMNYDNLPVLSNRIE